MSAETDARFFDRIPRLQQLAQGLSKEVLVVRGGKDPLLYGERKRYLKAVQDALAGLEEARVVLAGARQRIEGAAHVMQQWPDAPVGEVRGGPAARKEG